MEMLNNIKGYNKYLYGVLIRFFVLMFFLSPALTAAGEWKAGRAAVIITPEEPVWMAGYGSRTKPSEGKIHDLLHLIRDNQGVSVTSLFDKAKNKLEIIATFLALLELIRLKEVLIIQKELFGEIEITRNERYVMSGRHGQEPA